MAAAKKLVGVKPLLQRALNKSAFGQVAALNRLGIYEIAMLRNVGMLRWSNDIVEIWSGSETLEQPLVQALLREADRTTDLAKKGAFQMAMNGRNPFTFCFRPDVTVEDLKKTALSAYRVQASKFTHLGEELLSGPLVNYGVGPGSFIIAYPLALNPLRRSIAKHSKRPK